MKFFMGKVSKLSNLFKLNACFMFQKDDHTGASWDDKSDICVLKV